jgi:hypothetical protein
MEARKVRMACAEYLEDHAAYMDGFLGAAESASHEAHADSCASCARYARVLNRGLALVRELPEIEASPHFEERLRHRIFHIEDAAHLEARKMDARSGRSLAGVAIAATIALIAWSPMVVQMFERASSSSDANVTHVAARGSLMSEIQGANGRPEWYVQPARGGIEQTPVLRVVSDAGTYSPLIVSPPAARGPRAVRLVSATTQ